jgi:hypothetical protein
VWTAPSARTAALFSAKNCSIRGEDQKGDGYIAGGRTTARKKAMPRKPRKARPLPTMNQRSLCEGLSDSRIELNEPSMVTPRTRP